jgi:hypothetical protein
MANPNPRTDQLSPYKKGQSGNPGGKTSEQRRREISNAHKATKLREQLLDAMLKEYESGATSDAVKSEVLKLLLDSENRGLGQPRQEVAVAGLTINVLNESGGFADNNSE